MTPETAPADTSHPVTVESDDGRIFSGVGVTPESLAETMEARETPSERPVESPSKPADAAGTPSVEDTAAASTLDRNDDGTFKKSRGAKRFAALTADREREVAARTAAEQKAAALEARLAALEQGKQPETKPAQTASETFDEPEPTIDQFASSPDPLAAWVKATARWERRQEAWELRQKGEDLDGRLNQRFTEVQQRQAMVERVNEVGRDGSSKYPDWVATVTAPAIAEILYPDATYHAIVTAPNAADLVYTLAKDPTLARKVAQEADPFRLGVLLGSIRSSQAAVARPASTAPAVASSAPPPYQPVGSGSKTTSPALSDLAASGDDYDSSGYRERRAAERKGARR